MKITKKHLYQIFGMNINCNNISHECDRASFNLLGIDTSKSERQLLVFGDWSGGTNPNYSCNDWINLEDVSILKRPLSEIIDEHAMSISNVFLTASGLSDKSRIHEVKNTLLFINLISLVPHISGWNWSRIFKLLESFDYALPITLADENGKPITYSVEQLVEEGIYKLI